MKRLRTFRRASLVAREVAELGAKRAAFRVWWEARNRSGLRRFERRNVDVPADAHLARPVLHIFAEPEVVRARVSRLLSAGELDFLQQVPSRLRRGEIFGFSDRWIAVGYPVNWHVDPEFGHAWSPAAPWWSLAPNSVRPGVPVDVKFVWEAGRFPFAYHLARAATFFPELATECHQLLVDSVASFDASNPAFQGIHWSSGQEIAIRNVALWFAYETLGSRGDREQEYERVLVRQLVLGARQIDHVVEYAQYAVYNNHLLWEAVGLLLSGCAMGSFPEAERWRSKGLRLIDESVRTQFIADGGYIQLSHTYHRSALQALAVAVRLCTATGIHVPNHWVGALAAGARFLSNHIVNDDGCLPNTGANDGARPMLLASGEYEDFRPIINLSAALSEEPIGFADHASREVADWFGVESRLQRPNPRELFVARESGFHSARVGKGSIAFRCATPLERFCQLDQLHLDYWFDGECLLADGGTLMYGGDTPLFRHLTGTAGHNTIQVDDLDQMLFLRQFKYLYPLKAALVDARMAGDGVLFEGWHDGFSRTVPSCVHTRQVRLIGGNKLQVRDRVSGSGTHVVALRWRVLPAARVNEAGVVEFTMRNGASGRMALSLASSPVTPRLVDSGHSRRYGKLERCQTVEFTATCELPVEMLTDIELTP
jgi:hypothetical protein